MKKPWDPPMAWLMRKNRRGAHFCGLRKVSLPHTVRYIGAGAFCRVEIHCRPDEAILAAGGGTDV